MVLIRHLSMRSLWHLSATKVFMPTVELDNLMGQAGAVAMAGVVVCDCGGLYGDS